MSKVLTEKNWRFQTSILTFSFPGQFLASSNSDRYNWEKTLWGFYLFMFHFWNILFLKNMYLVFSSEKTLLNITTVAIEKKSLKRFYSHLWLLKGYFYCTLRKYDYLDLELAEVQTWQIFYRFFGEDKLTHSFPMHPFSTPWKHQKTLKFSDFFRR